MDANHSSFGISIWNQNSSIISTMNSWYPGTTQGNEQYDMDFARTGIALSFGRPFDKNINGSIKFNFEKNRIQDFWVTGSDHSEPSLTINNPKHPLEFWDNSIAFSLIENKLSYLDRNFVNGGYQLSVNYSIAGEYLGGEYNYQKIVLEGIWFKPFLDNLVLGTRLQGGYLTGDYPDYDAMYLGGPYKLRGFDDRRFNSSETKKLIGDEYVLSNTELRYRWPSNKNLEFVTFFDAGQMTNEGNNTFKSDSGIGFRYNTFLGMLRLDQVWNCDHDSHFVFGINEVF